MKFKKDKKRKKLMLLLILVLAISIGYAALATTLKINGNTTVKSATWKVYWDNVQPTTGGNTTVTQAATITDEEKTQVEYAVTLNEPGDYYEFTVDAVNAGTIDAMIAENGIVNKAYTDSTYTTEATLPKVLKYTVTYADGKEIEAKHLLAKKSGDTPTTETYKVRVEYRNDDEINPSDLEEVSTDAAYYFKFSVEYVQADGAKDRNASAITYVTRQNDGSITPGDVVRIGETEEFYVVSSDANNTVLLAKYNLLVGNIVEDWSVTGTIPSTTTGYGLQSSEATGYVDGDGNYQATTDFSSTNYWVDDDSNLISPYNENGASFDGNPYPYVYGSNSKIYQYISGENGYIAKLKAMGAPDTITGRLLTYEEADSIKEVKDNGTSIIFDGKQSYWLGSAFDYGYVWYVYSLDDSFYDNNCNYDGVYGVRPVIVISTSEI